MPQPNFNNRTLYHGDNLDFLRGLNSETVHLIATDPPFKKGRDFHSTPDSLAAGARFEDRWSWEDDVHEEWQDTLIDDWPAVWEVITAARASYGDDMGAFLCWLGVRLMECRRVLRPDGSLYLHIDHTAHAYVKCLMDAIFGAKNFRNEIVWCYTGPSAAKRWFPRKHDTILWYSKSADWTFNPDAVRVPYKSGLHNDGTVFQKTDGDADNIRRKETQGKIIEDWWTDIGSGAHISRSERTGYPTQKPLAVYERIIKASSNEGDIVLDPFCGCATTCVSAERQGRQWLGMDIWPEAHPVTLKRLEDEGLASPQPTDQRLLTFGDITYTTEPPTRTDENEVAAADLKLRVKRATEPWQRISRAGMLNILAEAQKSNGNVICAGCGRELELDFMQLDHITPKSGRGENHILNRILLCGPCNRRKRDHLTLPGLIAANKRKGIGWMKDEAMARLAQEFAAEKAHWVRDNFDAPECQALIRGS